VTFKDGILAHILRMHPGDVLWVRLAEGADVETAESVRDAVLDAMPRECSVILTEFDIIERMSVASLSDLLHFREVVDRAIAAKLANTTTEA
jgi:ABC-type uncharacterized transport system ATPase subunit